MTQPIDTESVEFFAYIQFQPDQPPFLTLQDAMAWVETLDAPTGVISYNGMPVLSYLSGEVDFGK